MSLSQKVITAIKWSTGLKFIGQIFTWAMTIIVIRLLSPEDYGLMAISVLFVSFLMMINEMGLGAVLVQANDLDKKKVQRIFGLIFTINSVFFIVMYLSAPAIAVFFDDVRLTDIIRILSLQFLISIFEVVPESQLDRELNFKAKSIAQLVANITGGVVTLSLAYQDYGIWSLVWGNISVFLTRMLGYNIASPYLRLPRFDFMGLRQAVSFGGLIASERVMWFFYTQADIFIIGKVLGKELLGIYTVAMHISSLIYQKTAGTLYEVAFPAFSKLQDEPEKISFYFIKATRITSYISFPMFIGISSLSPEIVAVLLGEKWSMATDVLMILCLIMPLRMISNIFPPILQGMGKPKVSVTNLLFATIVMPAAFLIGTQWGIIGVSISWVVAFPAVLIVMFVKTRKVVHIETREFFLAIIIPAALSGVMFLSVYYFKTLLGLELNSVINLLLSSIVGALSYAALSYLFYKEGLKDMLALVKR